MKKTLLKKTTLFAATVATLGLSLVPLGATASNGGWNSQWQQARSERWQAARCNYIDHRQARLFNYFDQNNKWLLNRTQFWINRDNARNCVVDQDIVENLVANGNFKTLTAAVGAAGLVDTLKSPGKFTVFAPTDQAFAKLPAGTVEALLGDIPTLQSILKYHVVSGDVRASVAKTLTSAPTVNGAPINISTRGGSLYINDSKVVLYDIRTTNGVIHVIDTVLLPS